MFHQLDQSIEQTNHQPSVFQQPIASQEPAIKIDDRTEQYHNELFAEHTANLFLVVAQKKLKFAMSDKKKHADNGLFTPEYSQLLLFSYIRWKELKTSEITPLHEIITGRKWTLIEMENNRNMLEKEKEEEEKHKNKYIDPVFSELFYGMRLINKVFNVD